MSAFRHGIVTTARRAPRAYPYRALTSRTALPLVGIIDLENRDGTIYAPDDHARQIESHELNGTARVVFTGASCIEDVEPALARDFSAVLLRRCELGESQLAAMPALRSVIRMGAGYDNIDLSACSARGVIASNLPDAWSEEVADSTLALMLGLTRHSFELSRFVAGGGGWTRQATLPARGMRRLRGRRLGIVGIGRIGTAVALRARAFGMEIAFYDPHVPPGTEKALGGLVRAASFGELVTGADVLSFHCPLTPETRHMLSRDSLQLAPRGLYVVNTARGGVLCEEALLEALGDGRVSGAALDALEGEPAVSDALLAAQRAGAHLVLTPHAAFYSDDAFVEMRHLAAREAGRVLREEAPLYQVN
jgi:lactate dehydrogenase-like 2-hydroxyacid dehydrogenase